MIISISVNKNNLKVVMDKYGPIIEKAMKDQMANDSGSEYPNRNASGRTARSIKAKTFDRRGTIGIEVAGGYGLKFLHTGRRPGAKPPPVSAIKKWMIKKGIAPQYGSINKSAGTIAYFIGRDGFKGSNIFGKAMERIGGKLLSETADAYIKDVEEHLKKFTKNA